MSGDGDALAGRRRKLRRQPSDPGRGPRRSRRAGEMDRGAAALAQLAITGLGLDADARARLAALRAGTGLKLPDCCVLLAAEQMQARVATFDDRLAASSATTVSGS